MPPSPERAHKIDYAALNEMLERLRQLDKHSSEHRALEIELFEMLSPICLSLAKGREIQAEDARTELLMRCRRGRLTFFSPTVFRQCLADAGREAFRGLPPRPNEANPEAPAVQVVRADEQHLSALPAPDRPVLAVLAENDDRARFMDKLKSFAATLPDDLRGLYAYLWSGDLSRGWKGRYAQEQNLRNGDISKRLNRLNERLHAHLLDHFDHNDPELTLEGLLGHLRADSPAVGNAPEVDGHE